MNDDLKYVSKILGRMGLLIALFGIVGLVTGSAVDWSVTRLSIFMICCVLFMAFGI